MKMMGMLLEVMASLHQICWGCVCFEKKLTLENGDRNPKKSAVFFAKEMK